MSTELIVPGISIAIPNWNHEYVLPRSITSALRAVKVLHQQNIPSEVLVIDDYSRDGSLVLLRQFEALYFANGLRVIAREQNGGLPVARNHALQEARYRYIIFMDADNELLPDNIYQFYRSIVQTEAAVVYGNLLRQGDAPKFATLMSNESFQGRMFKESYIDAFALFDTVQVREMGGYLNSDRVRAREDWELYLHLASNGRRIVFVPLVFGIYHAMPGSMIREASDTHIAQQAYLQRVYDQLGIRQRLLIKSRHLRYHPDIGYI